MSREGRFRGRRWPTPADTLLLHAALDPPGERARAWRAWRAAHDFDDLWSDATHILPLVARRLAEEGIAADDLDRLRGVYRRAWYENQRTLASGMEAVARMRSRGIPVMVFKGAPLMVGWYRDVGARSYGDVDVLVHREDLGGALDALREAGFVPTGPLGTDATSTFDVAHGVGFAAGPLAHVDLHTSMLEECAYRGADDGVWARARPMAIRGVDALCPSAADLLLAVCVHGVRGAPWPLVHWIADAMAVLGGDEPIDWDVVVSEARARRLTLALGEALGYLAAEFSAPVPARVLAALRDTPHGRLERLDFAVQGRAPGVAWMGAREVMRYFRMSRGRPLHRRVVGLPGFFRALWGLDHTREIPGEVVRRVRSRRASNAAERPRVSRV